MFCVPCDDFFVFFFKQKTAYEMRISDWSSDVCSSDLLVSGEIDAAHSLYGLIYAVHLGIGGVAPTDMAVLMGLNQNGQSINLSHGLQAQGEIGRAHV